MQERANISWVSLPNLETRRDSDVEVRCNIAVELEILVTATLAERISSWLVASARLYEILLGALSST